MKMRYLNIRGLKATSRKKTEKPALSEKWKVNDCLGFVMVNTYMQKGGSCHSIAEFMVLPKFRRNKIGKKAAVMCFEKYPGSWEVSPSCGSEQAYLFWKNVIDEYTDKKNEYEDGIFHFSKIPVDNPK